MSECVGPACCCIKCLFYFVPFLLCTCNDRYSRVPRSRRAAGLDLPAHGHAGGVEEPVCIIYIYIFAAAVFFLFFPMETYIISTSASLKTRNQQQQWYRLATNAMSLSTTAVSVSPCLSCNPSNAVIWCAGVLSVFRRNRSQIWYN